MKKLLLLLSLLLSMAGVQTALAQKMLVKTTDNGIVKFDISKVECVTFIEDEFVDLGLPSGTLWATCNIGASKPEEYGDYFAWGETTTKSEYTSGNYTFADNPTELPAENDAAKANWGTEWQMPTLEQCEELYNSSYTSSEWVQVNGVNGMKVTSLSNGKSIFLPAAGYYRNTELNSAGSTGTYWTASSNGASAYELYVSSSGLAKYGADRSCGRTIRPVRAPLPVLVEQIVLSPTSVSLRPGEMEELTKTILPANAANKAVSYVSSDVTVATVIQYNTVYYYVKGIGEGTCTITCRAMDGSGVYAECQVTVSIVDNSGTINGKDYIDLDLPSGTLWAACNVGANSPEEYGDYFAWGETEPKTEFITYKYRNGSENTMTKYCNNSSYGYNGFTDDLTELLPEDDAATANWGSDWQMPSREQIKELVDISSSPYVTLEWTTQNGVKGARITSKRNGNSIFLPAAGFYDVKSLNYAGSGGYYWSRTLMENCNNALIMNLTSSEIESSYQNRCRGGGYRPWGYPVRPVRKK
jgi:hypothetical protein